MDKKQKWNLFAAAMLSVVSFTLGSLSASDAETDRTCGPMQHSTQVVVERDDARSTIQASQRDNETNEGRQLGTGGATSKATAQPDRYRKEMYDPKAHAPQVVVAPFATGAVKSCEADLVELKEQLVESEKRRQAKEGTPIETKNDVAPRFSQSGLVDTFSRAFDLTDIDGRVESVDCTEYPCILFGRLHGDEGAVATLEDSAPFAVYDNDIGVMLTWASGDHAHEGEHKSGVERQKPPEISLFSFAFYSEQDRQEYGELIDRRIRVRTAEYWNASTPRE